MGFLDFFRSAPPIPFKKGVYVTRLIIEAFSSDHPDGSSQASSGVGADQLKISATRGEDGKIWLDKDVAWHELQHLLHHHDKEFGQPDENILKR